MRKLRIVGAILLSAALLLGGVGTALANDEEPTATPEETVEPVEEYQGLFGTVGEDSDIEGGLIKLVTKAHGEVNVILTEDTIYKVPGQKEASSADIDAGKRLAILVTEGEDGTYTAVRVMVVPGKATCRHVAGVVVSVEDKTMTITNANGETLTIEIPEGVKGATVGKFISAAVRQATDKERPVASGLQSADEVKARIQAHLEEVATRKAEKKAEIEQKGKDVDRLSSLLQGLAERHQEVLGRVLEKAPEQAKEAIQKAIDNSGQGLQKALESIGKAKAAGRGGRLAITPMPAGEGS